NIGHGKPNALRIQMARQHTRPAAEIQNALARLTDPHRAQLIIRARGIDVPVPGIAAGHAPEIKFPAAVHILFVQPVSCCHSTSSFSTAASSEVTYAV